VILESLALGRPAIVSDRAPISEALLGGGGHAVPYGDARALAHSLGRLLRDPPLRRDLADRGRAAVLERCDPKRVVTRYQQIYDRVLEEAPNHPKEGCVFGTGDRPSRYWGSKKRAKA
jgi:phosphatidylinositol alpha-mannosyltransferase